MPKREKKIHPQTIYTTTEAQDFLKISSSTIKRLLKKGIIKANKVGGRYKILGAELLRLVSPKVETKTQIIFHQLKQKVKNKLKDW